MMLELVSGRAREIIMFGDIGSIVASEVEKAKEFQKLLKSLPKEQADKLREERRIEREEQKIHDRKLEIANASRPRNFWGN